MKKPFYAALFITALFAFTGCSDDDDDELIGNWKKVSDFEGVPRYGAASFIVNDVAYVGAGLNSTKNYLNDLWRYNPSTVAGADSWTQMASFDGIPRVDAVGFGAGSVGLIGLGYNSDRDDLEDQGWVLSDFWRYNPSSNSWTLAAEFPGIARRRAVSFSVGTAGYFGTGMDQDENNLKDFWKYDGASDTWTQIESIGGSKRIGASSFVINNIAYVVGGQNNGSEVTDFWAYDASADKWTEKRKIANLSTDSYDDDYSSITRTYGAAFTMGGKGYLSTGNRNGSLTKTTWEYEPTVDLWTERTGFEGTARDQAIGFAVGGRGYILLGRSGSTRLDDVYEFFPTEEEDKYDN